MMIAEFFRRAKHGLRVRRAIAEIESRDRGQRHHGLGYPLIVSLTSHRPRFGTLALTLRSLLRQSVRPDRTVLWVEPGEYDHLPAKVLALQAEGLTIGQSDAWRSYGKILPALRHYPGHGVVVADDDVYYWPGWLAALTDAAQTTGLPVICHRADRITFDADGGIAPYDLWQRPLRAPEQSPLVLATGVQGVLYAPGCFHDDVTDDQQSRALCPSSDDIWLFWMYRMKGNSAAKIGGRHRIVEWPGTQAQSLRSVNMLGATGNDQAVAAMLDRYGRPF